MLKKSFLLFLLLVLVACSDEQDKPIPQPQPREPEVETQPSPMPPTEIPIIIVTRTPRPTQGPTSPPTPDFDMAPYEGNWTLMLRYDILDSPIADKLSYSTSVNVMLGLNGAVVGSGAFKNNSVDDNCIVLLTNPLGNSSTEIDAALANDGLAFRIEGKLRSDVQKIFLDLMLIPHNPDFIEHYDLRCFDKLDGSETTKTIQASILWPILQGTNQLNFSFDLTQYFTRSEFTQDITFSLEKRIVTASLTSEIYFGR